VLKIDCDLFNGLGFSCGGNVTGVLLATGDQAQITDPRNNVWTTKMDWLGFDLGLLPGHSRGTSAPAW
jgi:hypothetical protein